VEQVAVGFIFGVVQDYVETALNSSGDVFLRLWQRSSIGRKRDKSGD
jgi:Na+/serine symporter